MAGSTETELVRRRTAVATDRRLVALDMTVGVTTAAVGVAVGVGRRLTPVARPLAGVLLRPPVVAERYQPATWLGVAARRGAQRREAVLVEVGALLDVLVPELARAILRRMDLTDLVRRYVDLDDLVATVDLDGAVGRVDLDAIAGRLDLDAVIARIDLDRIVRERVDLDGIVATVDLDAVIERIDLVGLAESVIAEVDLPEIIRESTGTMASETVRGVRMQGVTADEAIGRAVDRVRLRRGRQHRDTS